MVEVLRKKKLQSLMVEVGGWGIEEEETGPGIGVERERMM